MNSTRGARRGKLRPGKGAQTPAFGRPLSTRLPRPRRARSNTLATTARRVEQRAAGFAEQLSAWLRLFALNAANGAVSNLKQFGVRDLERASSGVLKVEVAKASERELEAQLRRLLTRNLTTAAISAAQSVAGPDAMVTNESMLALLAAKEVKVQQIMGSMHETVQDSLRTILGEAAQEKPRPSIGELARRIRTQFHGDGRGAGQALALIPDPFATRVLPTQLAVTTSGVQYAFSSERAALIARTEMVQAENTGIVDGYKQTGAQWIEWIAYTDGRSGDRHHDWMDGERVRIGEQFELPDGTLMRYPGDPSAPIKQLANCRCTTRAIFSEDQAR